MQLPPDGLDRGKYDPVQISWSSLKRWENCPQHQLRTIKHQTLPRDGRIFLPGTICDLVQRRWLDSENPRPGEMAQMVDAVFEETALADDKERPIKWRGNPNEDMAKVRAFCKRTVTTLEPWLMENVLPYDYQPEAKFKAHMEVPYLNENVRAPLKMIGGIDIVVRRDDNKFRLYDLKITENDSYIRSTLGQLTFYDLAWCVIQGDFDSCVEWGFVTPALGEKYIPVSVTHDDRRALMARIVKYCHGVWQDQWEPKADDSGCTWCEARGNCIKFKEIAIVDENGKAKMSFAQAASQRAKYREGRT